MPELSNQNVLWWGVSKCKVSKFGAKVFFSYLAKEGLSFGITSLVPTRTSRFPAKNFSGRVLLMTVGIR